MKFEDLLICAKIGDDAAKSKLLEMYRPMLLKASIISGCFDEDLFQEECIVLMKCIDQFII